MSTARRDVLWGYTAQGLNIGAGLLLLPVVLHYLSPEDVGLWFVFITLSSLAQLLEFGFQPTLARNAAYVYAGALSLPKQGVPEDINKGGDINIPLLASLIASARRIYQIVALLAAIVLLLFGSLYIQTLLTNGQNLILVLAAWITFASGYILNFYFGYFNGIMQGRGDITQANKIVVVSRGLMVSLGIAAIVAGYGLIGLGFASLFSCIVGRWLASKYFFSESRPEMLGIKSVNQTSSLIGNLWFNASRLGAVQVGAFLIQRGNILVASSFLGLATAASYAMTMTILMALLSFSSVICQVRLPYMHTLQVTSNKAVLRVVYGEVNVIAWFGFIVGMLLLLLFGNEILSVLSSKTMLLPSEALLVLGVIILLELNHSIAASYLTTTNRIVFLSAALWSGIAIFLLSIVGVMQWQLWGLILAQGVVQLLYNNWKWPLEAVKDLGGGWFVIHCAGIKRLIGIFKK